MKDFGLNRNIAVVPRQTAMLFIDVQNYTMEDGGEYAGMAADDVEKKGGFFFREMRSRALPNMVYLQKACRKADIEVLYTVIASLKRNGRDLSLDYKISGMFCHKDSRECASNG